MRSRPTLLLTTALLVLASTPAMAGASPEPSDDPGLSPEPTPGTTVTLESTPWRLREARLSGAYASIPDEVVADLLLEGGNATGSGGCNRFFASYLVDGDAITFGQPGSTKMFCGEPQMTIETFYLADLGAVRAWSIEGSTLRLVDEAGQPVLAFEAGSSTQDITGIDWQLQRVLVDGVLTDVPPGVEATLRIDGDQAGGSTGCNRFGGGVTVDGGAISFEQPIQTERACEDPLMQVEGQYMGVLPAVASYTFDGATLQLVDANATVVLEFQAGVAG